MNAKKIEARQNNDFLIKKASIAKKGFDNIWFH